MKKISKKKEKIPTIEDIIDKNVIISKEDVTDVLNDLGNIYGLREWLEKTVQADVKRYFYASDDIERAMIKGAAQRTMYLCSLIKDNVKKKKIKKEKNTSINDISRYAV